MTYTLPKLYALLCIATSLCLFPCCKGSSGGSSSSAEGDDPMDEEQQGVVDSGGSVTSPTTLLPKKHMSGKMSFENMGNSDLEITLQVVSTDAERWIARASGHWNMATMMGTQELTVSGMMYARAMANGVILELESDADGEVEIRDMRLRFTEKADDKGYRRGEVEEGVEAQYKNPATGMMMDCSHQFEAVRIYVSFP